MGDLGILHNKPGRCVKCVLNGPFLFLMAVACIKTNGTNMQRATDTKPVTTGERAGPRNLVSLMVFSLVLYSRVTQSREAISERKACELTAPFVQSVSMNTIEIAKTNHNVSVKASPGVEI